MSGMDAAIQAVLLQAQALNDVANAIPDTLPNVIATGTKILNTGFATNTTVTNSACTTTSRVWLQAEDVGAANATGVFIATTDIANGHFTITHDALGVGVVATVVYFIV